MRELIFVFAGGGLGSCCRFLISKWMSQIFHSYPYGTLSANFLSCVILGAGLYLFEHKFPLNDYSKTFILVGFCGGFSTFSTYSNEILLMFRAGNLASGFGYMFISIILGLIALLIGLWIGKLVLTT